MTVIASQAAAIALWVALLILLLIVGCLVWAGASALKRLGQQEDGDEYRHLFTPEHAGPWEDLQ